MQWLSGWMISFLVLNKMARPPVSYRKKQLIRYNSLIFKMHRQGACRKMVWCPIWSWWACLMMYIWQAEFSVNEHRRLTTYSSRRHFPAFSVISTILWWWLPFTSLRSSQQGKTMELKFPQASRSRFNESAGVSFISLLTFIMDKYQYTCRTKYWLSIDERRLLFARSTSSTAADTAEENCPRRIWLASVPPLNEKWKISCRSETKS